MKEIQLTKGFTALVDDEDFERVNKFKWHVIKGKTTYYAVTHFKRNGRDSSLRMNILVMGTHPTLKYIDHIKGNGLDNQKHMLRFCTNS